MLSDPCKNPKDRLNWSYHVPIPQNGKLRFREENLSKLTQCRVRALCQGWAGDFWRSWAGEARSPLALVAGVGEGVRRGKPLPLHYVSKNKKPGQPGEEVRVVKHNGSPVSRWSLDNWVAHGGGARVRREQSGREITDNCLWKPLPCKAMTQGSWANICPISLGPSQSRLLSWNN